MNGEEGAARVSGRFTLQAGGHETTSALWSKLVPEDGDTLADTALSLIGQL